MEQNTTPTTPTPANTPPVEKTYSEAEYSAVQAQITSLQAQLAEANSTIQSFQGTPDSSGRSSGTPSLTMEGVDIDGIKKSAEEWKQKAEDWRQKAEQLEADQKAKAYSDQLDQFVQAQGMKNPIYAAHLKSQLMAAELKFDKDGTLIGGETIVKQLRDSCPDAFADTTPKPQFTGSTPGNAPAPDAAIRKIMGLK